MLPIMLFLPPPPGGVGLPVAIANLRGLSYREIRNPVTLPILRVTSKEKWGLLWGLNSSWQLRIISIFKSLGRKVESWRPSQHFVVRTFSCTENPN